MSKYENTREDVVAYVLVVIIPTPLVSNEFL